MATTFYQATGRRKDAMASVRLAQGGGKMLVNGKPMRQYLAKDSLMMHVERPLQVTETLGKVDVICSARGGGRSHYAGHRQGPDQHE